MHKNAPCLVPGFFLALCHVLVLALRPLRGAAPILGRERYTLSNRLCMGGLVALLALGVMTSQAAAQYWSNPSVQLSFIEDGRCLAGPYANASTTDVSINWTAFNNDGAPGRAIDLMVWVENQGQAGPVGGFYPAPIGQLPTQNLVLDVSQDYLVNGTTLYIGLLEIWNSGQIWSMNRSPALPSDVTPTGYGISGYAALDMTADPDCVPPVITGSVSRGTSVSPDSGPLNDGGTYDLGSVPAGNWIDAHIQIFNAGGGTLGINSVTTVGANNLANSQSVSTDTSADISLLAAEPGAFAYAFIINFTSGQNLVFTLTGTATDATPPRVASIVRLGEATLRTNADTLSWRVTYDKPVTGVDAGDFTLTGTTAGLSVSGSGDSYVVTATGGNLSTLDGTVTLQHAATVTIEDLSGNALVDTAPTGTNQNMYEVDNTPPRWCSRN